MWLRTSTSPTALTLNFWIFKLELPTYQESPQTKRSFMATFSIFHLLHEVMVNAVGDSYSVCVSVWYSSWCGNSPEAEGNVYSYGVHKQYKLYLLVEFNHMYLFLRTRPFTPMSFIASADCFYRRNFRLTNSLNVLNWIPLVGLYSIRINYKP